MTYSIHQKFSISLLAGIAGLLTVSCGQAATNSQANLAQANSTKNTADSVNTAVVNPIVNQADNPAVAPPVNTENKSDSPSSFEEITTSGLTVEMAYGHARAILISNGWTPQVHTTPSSDGYSRDLTLRELVDKGYEEVTACSGSGIGPCAYHFVYTGDDYPAQVGSNLSVTTTAANIAPNGDPTLWAWEVVASQAVSSSQ
ncbi:MAG: hypothetical protein AAFU53_18945, partial [Cyanobacteria bacterium J06632_3]